MAVSCDGGRHHQIEQYPIGEIYDPRAFVGGSLTKPAAVMTSWTSDVEARRPFDIACDECQESTTSGIGGIRRSRSELASTEQQPEATVVVARGRGQAEPTAC